MKRTVFTKGRYVADGIFYLLGSALYAFSVNVFSAPNDIAPGGLTGIATLLNYLFELPIGMLLLVMNIPLGLILREIFIHGVPAETEGWDRIIRQAILLRRKL